MSAGSVIPTVADVKDAYERLRDVVVRTPLLRNDELDKRIGAPVYVKAEPLQLTGSFKMRGAYNRISRFTDEEKARGVVAFSSGNHAQGVARAAKLLSIPAIIVMPSDAPKVKVEGVQRDGAEIVFYDRFKESREEIARDIAEKRGCVVVPSYDDFYVMSGQGSCGIEITQQFPLETPPQALICGVGGGGLISGVSLAAHDKWPETRIVGVEPQAADDHARSLITGERETNPADATSICDALMSPSPGELTFAINKHHLSAIALVTDEEAREAVRFAFKHLKVVAEPGGCVSLAALLAGKVDLVPDEPVIIVLTGGNIDPQMMADILASAV